MGTSLTRADRIGRMLFLVSLLLCNAGMAAGLVAHAVTARQPAAAAPARFTTPRPPQLGDVPIGSERA